MNFFGDSIAEIRYAGGLVSFRLLNTQSPTDSIYITVPFSDFRKIGSFMVSEADSINIYHNNWLEFERNIQSEIKTNTNKTPNEYSKNQKLGPLIGKV